MAIAHHPGVAIDCADAEALASFYGEILGWKTLGEDGWLEVRPESGDEYLAFQQVEGYRAPEWPGQDVPQQMHLDLTVSDLDEGEAAVIALGARKPEHQPGTTFRVFLDPAGHPFCLCQS